MKQTRIQIVPKLRSVFCGPARYRGAYGGRGAGRSVSFARVSIARALQKKQTILCAREIQESIKESVYREIMRQIEILELADYFSPLKDSIRCKETGSEYIFKGLRHNIDSIKSIPGIMICWIEEAEIVSDSSLRKLIPTIREPGSEIWLTWNPERESSAVNQRFIKAPPKNSRIIELNYTDNPWFPYELEQERLYDLEHNADLYDHVWLGKYLRYTDAQVMKEKFEVGRFEPEGHWEGPFLGLDFGFSVSPTAATKSWIGDDVLYIEHESYHKSLDLDETVPTVCRDIPGFQNHPSFGDSARPESVSYLRKRGLPMLRSVKKWPGSEKDGIAYLRSFRKIIIHPRCAHTLEDFRNYSYKTDPNSGEIKSDVLPGWDDTIDSIRYGHFKQIRSGYARVRVAGHVTKKLRVYNV